MESVQCDRSVPNTIDVLERLPDFHNEWNLIAI